jgi:tetratricopeptide (TPR) repeat protein
MDDWLRKRSQPEKKEICEFRKLPWHNEAFSQNSQVQKREFSGSDSLFGLQISHHPDLVMRANRMCQNLSTATLSTIAKLYRQAAEQNPDSAKAYAGLSMTLIAEGVLGTVHPETAYSGASEALQQSLEIDPSLPEAECAMAWFKMIVIRDWNGARQDFNAVMEQCPNYLNALIGRALLYVAEGCFPEALDLLQEVSRQNPLNTSAMILISWCNYLTRQYEQALTQTALVREVGHTGAIIDAIEALASVQLEGPSGRIQHMGHLATDSPYHSVLQGVIGYAYAISGQTKKAWDILDDLTKSGARIRPSSAYASALTLIGLGEKQKALECLKQSYLSGSLWSLGFLADPILASLCSEPHYESFLNDISYPVPEIEETLFAFAEHSSESLASSSMLRQRAGTAFQSYSAGPRL